MSSHSRPHQAALSSLWYQEQCSSSESIRKSIEQWVPNSTWPDHTEPFTSNSSTGLVSQYLYVWASVSQYELLHKVSGTGRGISNSAKY